MRIAVIGGTGVAGRHTVEALRRAKHEVVVVSRSRGVNLLTGAGLDGALLGADTVVDASSVQAADEAGAVAFFETATKNLFAAEQRTRVKHHVLLSIVGVDRLKTPNAHLAAKRRQEAMMASCPIPLTIQRATQFFEFAELALGWVRQGDEARLPPLLLQPLAAADVGRVLGEVATAPPQGRAADLAGPDVLNLIDMTRRILEARGERVRLIPSWETPLASADNPSEVFLPGPGARFGTTTFEAWLADPKRLG